MAKNKPTHEISLNVDGKAIIKVRTDEHSAIRVASAFGLKLDENTNAVKHWPLTIHKIGHETELEQQVLSEALAPKLIVPDGQVMLFLVGRARATADENPPANDEWFPLDTLLKRIYEVTNELDPMDWALLVANPGTSVPHFIVEDHSKEEEDAS
jgi:hypothetical protein